MKKYIFVLFLLFLPSIASAATWFDCNGDSFEGNCAAYLQIFIPGTLDVVSGQNSPVGSKNVWRFTIPKGFPMGGSTAAAWVATLPKGTQEMWIQYWWKYSPGFYLYNINKHVYFGPSNTMGVGLVTGWGVNCQPQGWGQANHPPNVNTSYSWYMDTGQWHKLKAHYRLNTPGQADGIFQAWVDDVMTNNYNNVQYVEFADGFQHPGFLMIPSGGGPPNPTLGYWYLSGMYVGSTDPGGDAQFVPSNKAPKPPSQLKVNLAQ